MAAALVQRFSFTTLGEISHLHLLNHPPLLQEQIDTNRGQRDRKRGFPSAVRKAG